MDDIFDPVFLPSSWADVDSPHSSSWISTTASQPSNIIPESFGTYRNNLQNLHGSLMIPSDHMVGNLPFHDPSVHMNGGSSSIYGADNIKCGVNPSYFSSENQLHHNIPNHTSLQPQPGTTESNQPTGSFCVERGSVGSNESDPSAYHQSLEDSQSTSADPLLWPSSHSNVQSLLIEQVDLHFGLQQKFVENDGALQSGIFQESENELKELNNSEIPSFTGGSDMNLTGNHIQSNDQPLQSSKENPAQPYISNASITPAQSMSANANGLNGTPKPRTRARRGQATDPHSIAERLRREKIADRMKNLQELVPNSNKADKASMLDEIIDYVKFLQLQVKVLSMSRLGAAGAVVPLITDIQSEGNGNLLSPSSVELGDSDPSETDDNLAFEQEVVKLMESNITMAMQYLQTKGLCLMPTALAAAISSRKGTSVAAIPPGKRKPDTSPAVVSNESMRKEISDRRELPKNSNGITVKHEDARTASNSGKEYRQS